MFRVQGLGVQVCVEGLGVEGSGFRCLGSRV